MTTILNHGGRVIDPSRGLDERADVVLKDGLVEAVGSDLTAPEGAEIIDATEKVVAPGLIDLHVHLREPGQEDQETIATGAAAAAALELELELLISGL